MLRARYSPAGRFHLSPGASRRRRLRLGHTKPARLASQDSSQSRFQMIFGELSGVLDRRHHVPIENVERDPALPLTRVHPRVQDDHHVEFRYDVQSLSAEPYRGGPFYFVPINQRAAQPELVSI